MHFQKDKNIRNLVFLSKVTRKNKREKTNKKTNKQQKSLTTEGR